MGREFLKVKAKEKMSNVSAESSLPSALSLLLSLDGGVSHRAS